MISRWLVLGIRFTIGITGWRAEVSGLCNVFQIFFYVFKIVEKYVFDLFIKYLSLFQVRHVDLRNMLCLYILWCWIRCLTSHGTCELLDWVMPK